MIFQSNVVDFLPLGNQVLLTEAWLPPDLITPFTVRIYPEGREFRAVECIVVHYERDTQSMRTRLHLKFAAPLAIPAGSKILCVANDGEQQAQIIAWELRMKAKYGVDKVWDHYYAILRTWPEALGLWLQHAGFDTDDGGRHYPDPEVWLPEHVIEGIRWAFGEIPDRFVLEEQKSYKPCEYDDHKWVLTYTDNEGFRLEAEDPCTNARPLLAARSWHYPACLCPPDFEELVGEFTVPFKITMDMGGGGSVTCRVPVELTLHVERYGGWGTGDPEEADWHYEVRLRHE